MRKTAAMTEADVSLPDALQRAMTFHRAGNLVEAEQLYKAVLNGKQDHPAALHMLGLIEFQRGRSDSAIRLIDEALAIRPNYVDALNDRGNILFALGRLQEALACYDQALTISPDHAGGLYNRGCVLQRLDRHAEALASYDQALAINPQAVEVHNNRGNILFALDRFQEALDSYDRAIAIRPHYAEALNNRGTVLNSLKRLDDALGSYNQALAINPQAAEVLNNRGNTLFALTRFQEALESYERTLAIQPHHTEALSNRGSALNALELDRDNVLAAVLTKFISFISPRRRASLVTLWLHVTSLVGRTGRPFIKYPVAIPLIMLVAISAIWLLPADALLITPIRNTVTVLQRYEPIWWAAGTLVMLSVAVLSAKTENSVRDFSYAMAFGAVIFCVALFSSLRVTFAALVVLITMFGLVHLSRLRFDRTGSNLHAYDFVYIIPDFAAMTFWIKNDRATALRLFFRSSSTLILLIVISLVEPPTVGRWAATLLLVFATVAFGTARYFLKPWHHFAKFCRPVHIARFVETIFEAFAAYQAGGVLRTESGVAVPKILDVPVALRGQNWPTIILILNESTFPPSVYVPERNEGVLNDFFQSDDRRTHGLQVEIFGGATWATEFSVLTGIPSSCYGPFATHVFHWARDRIHHSLPLYLKKCGYRTGLIFPNFKEFIRADRFYSSIGFDEIRDRRALKANTDREPDAFYLNQALGWLSSHFLETTAPMFLYLLTMSNHSPHKFQLIEEGGALRRGALIDGELNEYLRRLRRSCRDYSVFRQELAKRFPDREFLIVHFGDHQPDLTVRLRGATQWPGTADDLFSNQEIAFRTYFAINGVHFKPHIDACLPDTVEPAYLSTILLSAAGIPLDGLHELRQKLMMRHHGRLFFADDTHEKGSIAAQLNSRMIECGLISKH